MKRIALGVIANHVNSLSPYLDFIVNARKYGYRVSQVIIGYSHSCNEKILKILRQHVQVTTVQLNQNNKLKEELHNLGLSEKSINILLNFDNLIKYGLIAYGRRRNAVMIKSLLVKPVIDYLFFVDTDVRPTVLINSKGEMQEVDFIGRHMKYLQRKKVVVTTSDYSGYYIIPPMSFPGLKALLFGLQKEDSYRRVISDKLNLTCRDPEEHNIRTTDKILGGNQALDLNLLKYIPPYYSTTYRFKGELILGRGEDTLLGKVIPELGGKIYDVDTLIFHDTFDNFPHYPDINRLRIRERFYYAAMGWIGRNPFLNWFLQQKGYLDRAEVKKRRYLQEKALKEGSIKLANHLGDNRFRDLPGALKAAHSQLDEMIENYKQTEIAWREFKKLAIDWRSENESLTG